MYKVSHNTSTPKSPLKPEEIGTNFPKHFVFDKNPPLAESFGTTNQKYDFSRFAMPSESHSNETHLEDSMDNHGLAHEFQLRRDSSIDISEKGTKIVHSTLSPQAIWSIDHCGSCIAVGCRNGRIEVSLFVHNLCLNVTVIIFFFFQCT